MHVEAYTGRIRTHLGDVGRGLCDPRSPIDTEVADRYGGCRAIRTTEVSPSVPSSRALHLCIDVEVLAAHGDAQKYCECPIHCICRCALSQAEYAEPEASTPPV